MHGHRRYDARGSPRGRALGLALLAAAGFGTVAAAKAPDYRWEHEDSERGVELYVAESPAHPYDVVKAVATLRARPQTVLAALRDIENYPRWYHKCEQIRVLSKPPARLPLKLDGAGRFAPLRGDESYVVFFRQRGSPLADRWAIIENRVRVRDGALVVDFRSLDRHLHPAPKDAVRMRLRGRWILQPLSDGTRVSLTLDTDPKTSVPAFVVDPELQAVALQTVANLRRVVKWPQYQQRDENRESKRHSAKPATDEMER